MERIQFYPSTALKAALDQDAETKKISISALVTGILNTHYGLTPQNTLSLAETLTLVISEIKEYIKTLNINDEFDLLTASETFKNIEMVSSGKPSTNRATIGKIFSKRIGKEPFQNVEICRNTLDGKVKKTQNNATMYRIKKEETTC